MKLILVTLIIISSVIWIFPQANLIQSIDIDSRQQIVYGLTGLYDSSYVCRYKDGILEKWNLTEKFNTIFYWICTAVDQEDNIWAYMQDKLYKFDGISWQEISIPSPPGSYQKYSDLAINAEYLWLTLFDPGVSVYRLKLFDSSWTIFNSTNSGYPVFTISGRVLLRGDSTFISTNKGLVLIYNDSVNVILDTTNFNLDTQIFYSFFIDSKVNKWIGTADKGLIMWIDDTTVVYYSNSNSNLPDNFVNAIDEDSKGNIWLATDGGLACLRNDTITSYSELYSYSVIDLTVDDLDRIWLGTLDPELYMFDGKNLNIITSLDQEISLSENFKLIQNYPNPFNPTTTISYQISQRGLVTLKVYDVLGKDVVTLVNNEKPAGNYEVEFDASELPSGVYFYQLKAGSFIKTNKMIYLK